MSMAYNSINRPLIAEMYRLKKVYKILKKGQTKKEMMS